MPTPRQNRAPLLVTITLYGLIFIVCIAPLGWLALQFLFNPRLAASLKPDAFRVALLGRTLFYNGLAATLALFLSLPAAHVLGRGRGVSTWFLVFLLPIALLMPSITYTYGWLQFFRLINVPFEPATPRDIARCIWTLATWLWPLSSLVIGLSLRYLDSQVQQQALLDGVFWRTTSRQLAGPVAAGFCLVFILALQEFGVYERSGISVIATEARTVFETGAFSSPSNPIASVVAGSGSLEPNQPTRAAAALSVSLPLLLVTTLLVFISIFALSRYSAQSETVNPGSFPSTVRARWRSKFATSLVLMVTLGLPVASMLLSVHPTRWQPDAQGRHFILRVWAWAQNYALGSLSVGAVTALLAMALAALSSIRRSRLLLPLALASFLVGGELLAIGNIRLYNRSLPGLRVGTHLLGLVYNNIPIMVIALLGRFGWLALAAGRTGFSKPFQEIRDMASLDGATPGQSAVRVIWPLVGPVLLASALVVMILCMTEVSTTVLVAPQRPQMLVPVLMTWVHMLRYDDMLEGSLLLMFMVTLLGVAALVLTYMSLKLTQLLRRPQGV